MITNLKKPSKDVVSQAIGLSWSGGALFQEKLDGKFTEKSVGSNTLVGEDVGVFTCFDIVEFGGKDVRGMALTDRIPMRNEVASSLHIPTVRETTQNASDMLEMIWSSGGEGAVRKEFWATYYTPMLAAKRLQTWKCVVRRLNNGVNSVQIADALTGEDRGGLKLGMDKVVRVGSIIKVEGFGLHKSGLIREARVCKDTPCSWLITY